MPAVIQSSALPRPDKCPECESAEFKVRRKPINGGTEQYRWQCMSCGVAVGVALKKAAIDAMARQHKKEIEPFDAALEAAGKTRNEKRRALRLKSLQLVADQQQAQRRAFYENYLHSARWKAKRERVIKRCGNICEGCGRYGVDHVHHLTYDKLGNELLFQLVGLCRECHEEAHDRGQEELWREYSELAARGLK